MVGRLGGVWSECLVGVVGSCERRLRVAKDCKELKRGRVKG